MVIAVRIRRRIFFFNCRPLLNAFLRIMATKSSSNE
jgi:hypothetical protein